MSRWPHARSPRSCALAVDRHGLCAAAAEHRVGTVPLSEPSVAVVASAPASRRGVCRRVREMIDEIKARAPIWKKEEGRMGSRDDTADLSPEGAAGGPRAGGNAGAPRALAVTAARRRSTSTASARSRRRRPTFPPERGSGSPRATAVAAACDQRHRRGPPHQPRPRPAGAAARGRERGAGATPTSSTSSRRRARLAATPTSRRSSASSPARRPRSS